MRRGEEGGVGGKAIAREKSIALRTQVGNYLTQKKVYKNLKKIKKRHSKLKYDGRLENKKCFILHRVTR